MSSGEEFSWGEKPPCKSVFRRKQNIAIFQKQRWNCWYNRVESVGWKETKPGLRAWWYCRSEQGLSLLSVSTTGDLKGSLVKRKVDFGSHVWIERQAEGHKITLACIWEKIWLGHETAGNSYEHLAIRTNGQLWETLQTKKDVTAWIWEAVLSSERTEG